MAFAGMMTVYAASGVLAVNAIAQYWVEAYQTERTVLAGVRQRFPTLAPHSVLILDGVCPYTGPAIVFESDWDLAGALQVMYRDPTLGANVVTPRLHVGERDLTFTLYSWPTRYPYSSRLFVYDAQTGGVHPVPDQRTAEAYFARALASSPCQPGFEGIGVEIIGPERPDRR